jgi:hypothetical protein
MVEGLGGEDGQYADSLGLVLVARSGTASLNSRPRGEQSEGAKTAEQGRGVELRLGVKAMIEQFWEGAIDVVSRLAFGDVVSRLSTVEAPATSKDGACGEWWS